MKNETKVTDLAKEFSVVLKEWIGTINLQKVIDTNRTDINVLVGCEESQAIALAFRKLGVNAFSCDLKPCSGGHPQFHIQSDVFRAINDHFIYTQTGERVDINIWHLGIFHPECTYLTVTANKWLKDQPARKSGALVGHAKRTPQ